MKSCQNLGATRDGKTPDGEKEVISVDMV
jgi:hypothetical protein